MFIYNTTIIKNNIAQVYYTDIRLFSKKLYDVEKFQKIFVIEDLLISNQASLDNIEIKGKII